MKYSIAALGAVFSLITALHGRVCAAADPSAHVEASLLAEPGMVAPGQTFRAGLHLKLEPDWHVYWKNPGDAGLPVSMNWTLPKGAATGPILWPYPSRIEVPPLMNYGYHDEVLLPIDITTPAQAEVGGKFELKAKAKWVVCKDICLPGGAELSLSVPVGVAGASNPVHAALFSRAQTALPLASSEWTFSAQAQDSTLLVIATPPAGTAAASASAADAFSFFPDIPDLIEYAAPQKFYPVPGGYALELKAVPPEQDGVEGEKAEGDNIGPDSLTGVAVSESGWNHAHAKAVEVRVPIIRGKAKPAALAAAITVSGNPPSAPGSAGSESGQPTAGAPPGSGVGSAQSGFVKLLLMLLLAFTGGLILNLMPCVLPVLSLKIFDFVKRAGQSRWKIFSHGLVFTAGVLISFWFLAGLLLILRSGGSELGWGFQLQSPGFLVVLCALFFFFSLNLFGVFELGYLFTRIGGATTSEGWLGSFLAGVTATVVATPCTAPFMGSAMGYAFTQPPYYAMLVFTFLGLGMAAPYLLLSGFPGLMKYLPRPGEWMEHLKQFMGFPLLATAIWLAWVLGKQAGVDALIALLFVLLLAGMSAWILGKWTALHKSTPVRVIAWLVALVVFVPAFILVLIYLDQIRDARPRAAAEGTAGSAGRQVTENGMTWEPFSEARVAELVGQGKPVFVDFTADWCLSCKVNEKVAFGSSEVRARFNELGLTVLKADWTLRDDIIARALAKFGRNSIPLYVLYSGKGMDDFVLLPEVLSPRILLEALNKIEKVEAVQSVLRKSP
ncbi:MAG: protein-disulfide reductase DsbD domain-containing protein [Fibrobacteria bacterium]